MTNNYDIAVIWAGSWWLTVAIWLSSSWKTIALIEEREMWWDCTNYWCIPSKALIDIAKKWEITWIQSVLQEVRKRRQEIRDEETEDIMEKKYWIKVFKGRASFENKNTLLIWEKEKITANKIIISVWSKPNVIDIEWVNKEDILTNESIFELEEDIENLVVIWWWYIWCELTESFANLWVNVSIVQRNERLIPREEQESSAIIHEQFERKDVNIFTDSEVLKAENSELIIRNRQTDRRSKIKYDKILIALWRKSNISSLELKNAWIKYDKGWIIVNKYNQSTQKHVFAIWDCVSGNPQFTHWANNEWRWVIRNILFSHIKSSNRNALLPAVLYTNKEVARVWKTEEELLKDYWSKYFNKQILYFKQNDRSKVTKDRSWFVKINFRSLTWEILWGSIVWSNGWELLPVITSAMENNISAYKLSKQIFAYPTKSELIKKVCDKFVVKTLTNLKTEFKNYILTIF